MIENNHSTIHSILQKLGYEACSENAKNSIFISLHSFKNHDGSIRWIWPKENSTALFLNFYNVQGWKARCFAFVMQIIFILKLNRWFFKSEDLYIVAQSDAIKFDFPKKNWALFTGTTGPNQKFIIYQSESKSNGVFIKIPISNKSIDLIKHEASVLNQLSKNQIKSFDFPMAKSNDQNTLNLSYPAHFNLRIQNLSAHHFKVFQELESISSDVCSFEAFCEELQLEDRLTQLSNNRKSIPSGIIKKLQKLMQSMHGSFVKTHMAHMDFTPWNMYSDAMGNLYIYDWELATMNSPKGFDFFHFVIQKGVLTERKNWKQIRDEINQFKSNSYFENESFDQLLSLYLLTNILYYLEVYQAQEKWHQQVYWLLNVWNEALSDVLSNSENHRELVILDILDWLNERPYAGLKLADGPVEKLSVYSDLDILIHRSNAIVLRNYLKNHPLISQLKIQKNTTKTALMLITKSDELLSIDCIHQLKRKNLEYMSVDEMISKCEVDGDGINRVNKLHHFEFINFFYGLNNAAIPEKFITKEFVRQLDYSKLNALQVSTFQSDKLLQHELKNLIKNESKNKGLSYIKNTIKYAIDSLWNAVSQKGMIISFSGVDGAGKSTIIEHTKHEIEKKLRKEVIVIRHRPSLLPILSVWTKGKKRAEFDVVNSLPRQGQNRNVWSSMFRFLYYYSDYLFGQFYIYMRYVSIGKIVLYDRYYFDFINDSLRSNIVLPKWILKSAYRFLLQPDLNFFLYADSKTILSRKKELDESSIKSLTMDYLRLFSELNKKNKHRYFAINNLSLSTSLFLISNQIQNKLFH